MAGRVFREDWVGFLVAIELAPMARIWSEPVARDKEQGVT
jgi:hypothetical protein